MAELLNVLRAEIARLARKEIKGQVSTIKKASAQHRREIAELKRKVVAQERLIAFLESQEKKRLKEPAPTEIAEKARFSAKGLRSHREKIGLSQEEYGALVGVTHLSIYNWESGKAKPRKKYLAALVEIRKLGKKEALKKLEALWD